MGERLDKFLASQGLGTRKEVGKLIRSGAVLVNGAPQRDPGAKVEPGADRVTAQGEEIRYQEFLTIMLNKPAGVLSTTEDRRQKTVLDLLPEGLRRRGLFPAGRLDKDTTGLLLLSDDGNFIHRYTSPRKNIPKTYHVTTVHPVDDGLISRLKNGVTLRDENIVTRALHCQANTHRQVTLVIAEGKYHQVKRMIAAAGNRVENLHRAAIGGFSLDVSLPVGHWRFLDETDLASLDTPGTM